MSAGPDAAFPVFFRAVLAIPLAATLLSTCGPSSADLDALRQEQAATRRQLEEVRKLLEQKIGPGSPPPGPNDAAAAIPAAPPLRVAKRPSKGKPDAPITLLEFSDFQCPYCAQHATSVFPRIDREYVQTGRLRYVFKHFPVTQAHPLAFGAHVAAACAGDEGKYWEMHARLFANPGALAPEALVAHAAALGLGRDKFRACRESGRHDALIREDINEAVAGGVGGTPVFALAFTTPGADAVRPVRVLVGAQPFEAFKDAIDGLLSTPSGVRPPGTSEEVR